MIFFFPLNIFHLAFVGFFSLNFFFSLKNSKFHKENKKEKSKSQVRQCVDGIRIPPHVVERAKVEGALKVGWRSSKKKVEEKIDQKDIKVLMASQHLPVERETISKAHGKVFF